MADTAADSLPEMTIDVVDEQLAAQLVERARSQGLSLSARAACSSNSPR